MRSPKAIFSVVWCALWATFAVYCLLAARGHADLRNPMGPAFAPEPGAQKGTFATLGDCHSYRRSLQGFLRTASNRGVQFGVLLGDFVDYDEDIAYHHLVDRLGEPPFPIFLARGNHEGTDFQLNDTHRYSSYIPQTSRFFVHAGVLVGILDNGTGDFAEGCLRQAREEILSFRQERPDAPVLLAMHIPPTIEEGRSDDLSASATRAILDLCSEFRVDYLVCGHVHDHIEFDHDNTTILIDGCGGGSLPGPSTDVHYLEFTVKQGGISFERVALARDHPIIARADYLFHVSVPRFRWWFFLLACIIALREAWSLRRTYHMSQSAAPSSSDTELGREG